MRRILLVLLALLLCASAAHAQTGSCKSASALNSEINSSFPDFTGANVGVITPALTRQMLLNMVASGDCLVENGDSNFVIPNNSTAAVTSTTLSAARVWTLPAASNSTPGAILLVLDLAGGVTSGNTLTIHVAGSDTMNGGSSVAISAAYGGYLLISDGVSKWSAEALGVSAGGGGGSVSAGGAPTQVNFNCGGLLCGDTGFTYFGNGTAFLGFAGTSSGVLGFAGSVTGDILVQAPPSIPTTYNLVLPTGFGTNNFLLQETLVGTTVSLGWVSPTSTVNNVPCTLGSTCTIPLIVGTTPITSGTNLNILYDNNGVLGIQGISGSGNVVLTSGAVVSGVSITSANVITGLPAPVNSSDAATKAYVDATAAGLVIHSPVQWATAAVLANTPTYNNASSGVGATLTAASNAAIVVDGANPVSGDRVLVKNQALAFENGVYSVTTQGFSGSTPWQLTRTTDFNAVTSAFGGSCTPASSCIAPDSYFFVQSGGTANGNSSWVLTNTGTVTVGTTSLTWAQFSASSTYTAGTGLNLVGSQFSLASPYTNALTSSGGTINFSGTPSTGQIPVASGASTGTWTTLYTQPTNILSIAGSSNLGITDNAGAISTGLAALTTPGSCLYFPGGYYLVSTQIAYVMPAGPSSFCIEGDALGATVLFWPNAAGGISVGMSSPAQSVHVRNLSALTKQGGGGTAFNITQTSALADFAMNTFDHVLIGPYTNASSTQYWNTGIIWNDVSGTDIGELTIFGPNCSSSCPTTLGIQYEGTASGKESIYHYLHNSSIFQVTTGASINAWTQGVVIDTVNFENGQACTGGLNTTCAAILIGGTCPGGDDRVQFVVNNSLVENDFGGAGLLVKCVGSSLQLTNNTFVGSAGNYDLLVNAAFTFVQASNNNFSCGSTGTCIYSIGGWGQYYGNQLNSGTTGINFPNTGAFNSEWGNICTSVTTCLTDSQTTNPAFPWGSNSPLNLTWKGQQSVATGAFASAYALAVGNTNNTSGAHGMTVQAGLNGASDSSSNMIAFLSGNGSNLLGYIGRNGTGLSFNPSPSSAGQTCSGLPTASFATVGGIVTHC